MEVVEVVPGLLQQVRVVRAGLQVTVADLCHRVDSLYLGIVFVRRFWLCDWHFRLLLAICLDDWKYTDRLQILKLRVNHLGVFQLESFQFLSFSSVLQ